MFRSAVIGIAALSVAVPTSALAQAASAVADDYTLASASTVQVIPELAAWSDEAGAATVIDADGTYGPVLPAEADEERMSTGEKALIGTGVVVGVAIVVVGVLFIGVASRDWEN